MLRSQSGVCILTRFAAISPVSPVAELGLSLEALGGVTCVFQHRCRSYLAWFVMLENFSAH